MYWSQCYSSISKDCTNNILASGSKNNARWEVSSVNNKKGTFSLLVRRGDDTIKRNIAFGIGDNNINEEAIIRSTKLAQMQSPITGLSIKTDFVKT